MEPGNNPQKTLIAPAKNKRLEELRFRIKGSFFGTESDNEGAGELTPKHNYPATLAVEKKRRANRSASAINLKIETGTTPKQNMERLRGQLKTTLFEVKSKSWIDNQESPNSNNFSFDLSIENTPNKGSTGEESHNDLRSEEAETPSPEKLKKISPELKPEAKQQSSTQLGKIVEAPDQDEQTSPLKMITPNNMIFKSFSLTPMACTKDIEIEEGIFKIYGTFENYYDLFEVLGEGTSGTVKRAISKSDGKEYAIKITNYRGDEETVVLITKEFKNHRRLKHKNIVQVYELYVDELRGKIYAVLELARCREMFDVIHELGHYSESVAANIFKQILLAIQYLHAKGVCHRDLKPNNILVSDDGSVVKITDFNVSKFIDDDKKTKYSGLSNENYKMWTYTGTVAFTAPEVFIETEYTEAVDMWSAGVVLYTMLCGYQPFQAEYLQDLIQLIKSGKYDFHPDSWGKISNNAKELVSKLIKVNYKERFSPSEALAHLWILNEGKDSVSRIDKTIQNLKSNLKKNSKNFFLREPQSGLVQLKPHEKFGGYPIEGNKTHIFKSSVNTDKLSTAHLLTPVKAKSINRKKVGASAMK